MSASSTIVRPDPAALGAGRPWRRVMVYGLGVSGLAASRLLLARGITVYGADARPAEELDLADLEARGWLDAPGLDLLGEDAELPADVDAVVVSPGVPPGKPLLTAARERGLPVISEVELAFPLLDGPVVGITGSNGKSTTTAMTGAILEAAGRPTVVCGNIGDAVSAHVPDPAPAPGRDGGDGGEPVYVVELSSYQLEDVEHLRPRAAAMLNLSPDHLDRYGDMDSYAAAKANIFRNQGDGDVAVLNADDPRSREMASAGRRRFFSRTGEVEDGCHLRGDEVVEVDPAADAEADDVLFQRSDLALPGAHNLENAMAAALLARALGADADAVRRGLAGVSGLAHRLQRVLEADGVAWWDDSKATNFAAVAKSLEDMPDGAVHLILGGKGKGDDPAEVVELARRKVKRIYLVGAAADDFARAFAGVAPIERCGDLEHAVPAAAEAAEAGDVVLLSPACASFDQFDDFAHRGRVYQQLVRLHAGQESPDTSADTSADSSDGGSADGAEGGT